MDIELNETSATPSVDNAATIENTETTADNTTQKTDKEEQAQQQIEKNLKKFKLKVDGEEIEEEVDLNDIQRITKALQMEKVAKKRMTEAYEDKKRAYELAKAFDEDPTNLLKRLGPKGIEAAEKYLLEHLQEQAMTPQEREFMNAKKELESYRRKEQEQQEFLKQQQQQAFETKVANDIQATLINSLKKADVPPSAQAIKRMAQLYKHNLNLGLDLSPEDLAEEYKVELSNELNFLSKDSSIEQLIKFLGPDKIKALREHDIKEMKSKQKLNPYAKADATPQPPKSQKREWQSMEEFREWSRNNAKS